MEGSTQFREEWASVGGMGDGLSTGTFAAVPPALSPKAHSPIYPFAGAPGECLSERVRVLDL